MNKKAVKKIGLITLHSFYNYGSMLQAYALNHYLNVFDDSYECELIDYVPPRQDDNRSYALYKNDDEYFDLKEKYKLDLEKRKKCFSKFMKLYTMGAIRYGSDEEIESKPPIYDAYISGSDQIWNVNFRIASRAYFLSFANSGKKYAFATSIGRCTCEKLEPYVKYISRFDKIFIREESGIERIKEITNRNDVRLMSDPTMLLGRDSWEKLIPEVRFKSKKYIACYATLDEQLDDMLPILDELHYKTGYEVILFGMTLPRVRPYITNIVAAGPFEFLHIIHDASFVLTHSFHGTVFSIIFNVPFLTFNDDTANFRKTSLLQRFSLTGRIIHCSDDIDKALSCKIDFKTVNKLVAEYSDKAKKDIALSLEGVK